MSELKKEFSNLGLALKYLYLQITRYYRESIAFGIIEFAIFILPRVMPRTQLRIDVLRAIVKYSKGVRQEPDWERIKKDAS